MSDIIELMVNNGIAVVVVAYFLFRDYKFNQELVGTLAKISSHMETMSERMVNSEDNK
jgi:hypothetical protein